MSYRVEVSAPARRQLDANTAWWAENRSANEAACWYRGIRERIARLRDNPQLHGLADEDADFPNELRELLFGLGSRPTHRAVFAIRGDVVTVLAIRHVAQDRLTPDDVTHPDDV